MPSATSTRFRRPISRAELTIEAGLYWDSIRPRTPRAVHKRAQSNETVIAIHLLAASERAGQRDRVLTLYPWGYERRAILRAIPVTWEQCQPECPGWYHFSTNSDSDNVDVERCDDCRRFASDSDARRAHAAECPFCITYPSAR